jgi:hypothetical protein
MNLAWLTKYIKSVSCLCYALHLFWAQFWFCMPNIRNTIFMLIRPPLWSSGQSSWQQIQRPGFHSRHYQFFWEVVGLEPGQLSLVSTTEELLWRKSIGSGLENREYSRRDPSPWPRGTFYPQNFFTNFADKRLSFGRYSSLTGSDHVVLFVSLFVITLFSFLLAKY